MRRLLLLRHSKTERPEPGERDRDRKLTERGRLDAPIIGAYMARHRFIPDRVLVSPAIRTRETWELAAAAFAKTPPITQTSTSQSDMSCGRCGASTMVAAYQLPP